MVKSCYSYFQDVQIIVGSRRQDIGKYSNLCVYSSFRILNTTEICVSCCFWNRVLLVICNEELVTFEVLSGAIAIQGNPTTIRNAGRLWSRFHWTSHFRNIHVSLAVISSVNATKYVHCGFIF